MSEKELYTFAAIITVSLPDERGEKSFDIVLTPADKMEMSDGTTKLLQDCTLAEIADFADNLQRELWEEYLNITLLDLALGDETEVTVHVPEYNSEGISDASLWMEHLVVFSSQIESDTDLLSNQSADQGSSPENGEVSDLEIIQVDSADKTGDESLEVAAPVEIQPKDEEKPEEDTLEEALKAIDMAVAETEQVHQEAVAQEQLEHVPPTQEAPEFRILGRRRPLNHPTWTAVDILINEPAFRDAQAHAISSFDREVAGILVGPTPEKQPDGRYIVHISDIIIAKYTRMHGASVTYTPESWRYVTDKLNELYPADEAVIVGWYHTHPGFGIFLSSMDRFIHQNFFIQKWHVALVLDPVARRSGFFCWDKKQAKVDPYEFPWPQWAVNSW